MWQRALEAYLTERLMRSPGFHRGVGWLHKRLHEVRHGKNPEDMGGTKLDQTPGEGFGSHFLEEVKRQLKGTPSKPK